MGKKSKKKKVYAGPVLVSEKIITGNYVGIGKTFGELANQLSMELDALLPIFKKLSSGTDFKTEDLISNDVWPRIKEFVHNKLSLIHRKEKILEAKTPRILNVVRPLKKLKLKNEHQKKLKSKSSPYFIKGNLSKVIYNGMTN